MQEVLPEGGVVRKLWIGESAKYREHLLRLDPQSRRNRFSGGEAIRDFCAARKIGLPPLCRINVPSSG